MNQFLSQTKIQTEINPGKVALADACSGEAITYGEFFAQININYSDLVKNKTRQLFTIGEPAISLIPRILACSQAGVRWFPLPDHSDPSSEAINHLSGLSGRSEYWYANESSVQIASTPTSKVEKEDLVFITTPSSGSTGHQKYIELTTEKKILRTKQSIDLFSITPNDTVLSASPLSHSLGQRHLFVSILSGATWVRLYPYTPKSWINSIRDHQITFTIPVSTHLHLAENLILENPEYLRTLRCMVASSASCSEQLKRTLNNSIKTDLWEIYGASEIACATALKLGDSSHFGSVGEPLEDISLQIHKPDNSGTGEILVKTPYLADGYHQNTDLWNQSITDDGYFKTGDLGMMKNGELYFLGRKTFEFVSGGKKINPHVIEDSIKKILNCTSLICHPIEDPIFGQLPALIIESDNPCTPEIRAQIRNALPKWEWPVKIRTLSDFPKLPSGKTDRLQTIRIALEDQS
jgi:long-chain acyl-CoA synthetase